MTALEPELADRGVEILATAIAVVLEDGATAAATSTQGKDQTKRTIAALRAASDDAAVLVGAIEVLARRRG